MPYTAPGNYLSAIAEHADECEVDLAKLKAIASERSWHRLDELAAQRALQVLIEACIGVAKHWCKAETRQVSTEALQSFKRLHEAGVIGSTENWRKMIGLRNALVHDYLEIDDGIILSVVQNDYYQEPLAFIRSAIKALKQP
jgi:uncharacterized protein YutE (UPF0331/DUF86 family)